MDKDTTAAAEKRKAKAKGDTFRSVEPFLSGGAVADDDNVHAPAPSRCHPTPISASESEFKLWVRKYEDGYQPNEPNASFT